MAEHCAAPQSREGFEVLRAHTGAPVITLFLLRSLPLEKYSVPFHHKYSVLIIPRYPFSRILSTSFLTWDSILTHPWCTVPSSVLRSFLGAPFSHPPLVHRSFLGAPFSHPPLVHRSFLGAPFSHPPLGLRSYETTDSVLTSARVARPFTIGRVCQRRRMA